jgi:hypothetical protein
MRIDARQDAAALPCGQSNVANAPVQVKTKRPVLARICPWGKTSMLRTKYHRNFHWQSTAFVIEKQNKAPRQEDWSEKMNEARRWLAAELATPQRAT